MKVRISALEGPALRWVVASIEYPKAPLRITSGKAIAVGYDERSVYSPDTHAVQAWHIISREGISLQCLWPGDPYRKHWQACFGIAPIFEDRSPEVAGLRCFVAKRRGDVVDVPDELVEQSFALGEHDGVAEEAPQLPAPRP